MPKLLFTILYILLALEVKAQSRKFYTIKNDNSYDKIIFKVQAQSGNYKIIPSKRINPIDIFGSTNHEYLNPSFTSKKINKRTRYVNLRLENLYDPILTNLVPNENNLWEFFINEEKKYDLIFDYNVADANVNLSKIPIENVSFVTGNANLKIYYNENEGNPIQMDSLKIKIEIGSLDTKNINLSNANIIFTEIGFGNILLDIAKNNSKGFNSQTNLSAGKLIIKLPIDNTATKIEVSASPLSTIDIPEDFHEIKKNVFVNKSYFPKSKNIRSFRIDLGLGNITVNYKK